MPDRTIRLCYRKIIGAENTGPWEQLVFSDTVREYRMQAQYFDPQRQWPLFTTLLHQVTQAHQLHYLVSTAAIGYLKQLGGKIPDITDRLGQTFLPFQNFRFELVEASMFDNSRHRVAVNFYSDPVYWIDTIGSELLLSLPGALEDGAVLTHLLPLTPFLSIYSLTETTTDAG